MKKPNITDGEWYVGEVGKYYGGLCTLFNASTEANGWVEVSSTGKYKINGLANAKAISAVPELIDALIRSYELLSDIHQTHPDYYNGSFINQIESALIKAGCTE